jgi:VanZ family protein
VQRHHIYLILWGLFLIALSLIPGRQMPHKISVDKFFHVITFAYLGYLAARSLGWWGLAVAVVFGILNEIQQFVAPGREVVVWDFVANEIGVIAGFIIGFLRRRRALSTG